MAADDGDPRLTRLVAAAAQDVEEDYLIELGGERDDVQGEKRSTPHRVDVAYGVGGGDRAESVRVIDDGGEEIDRRDERLLLVPRVHRGVVGGVEADKHIRRQVATECLQRLGQVLRT